MNDAHLIAPRINGPVNMGAACQKVAFHEAAIRLHLSKADVREQLEDPSGGLQNVLAFHSMEIYRIAGLQPLDVKSVIPRLFT